MTSTRQPRKARLPQAFATLALLALAALLVGPSRAAVTERVVTDIHTGIALDGYDPVAYFTDAQAKVGRPEFEYRFRGVVWQFSNEGNRGAFAAHAEIYVPRFGGYDPVAIARGVAVAGNPTVWCIWGERLYLFYRPKDRDSFAADAASAIAAAEAKWPEVRQGLAQ